MTERRHLATVLLSPVHYRLLSNRVVFTVATLIALRDFSERRLTDLSTWLTRLLSIS